MSAAPVLFLFHREFRLFDNTGLNAAARSGRKIIPTFIFEPVQIDPRRNDYFCNGAVQFMCESLDDLDQRIRQLGSKMVFMHGDTVKVLDKLHKQLKFDAIFSHEDNTPFAEKRDTAINNWAKSQDVDFVRLEDYDLYSYRDGLRDGKPYLKYTPFHNFCLKNLQVRELDRFVLTSAHFVEAAKMSVSASLNSKQIHKYYTFNEHINIRGGRENGEDRLDNIRNLKQYDHSRNDVNDVRGTSHLSPYIKFGVVSIREVYWKVISLFGANHGLIRELIWRSFYYRIAKYTDVLEGRAMKKQYENVKWNTSRSDLKRFATATTFVPLIDASIRNLATSNWLHNRLRMLVANFACKDLLLDWRLPEKVLASIGFLDYDPSSTNGGMQWSASSGADSMPYFRSFNSYVQTKRYDPECAYIKKWVPELRDVPPKHIIDWENQWKNYKETGYGKPIVSHKEAHRRAVDAISKGIYNAK